MLKPEDLFIKEKEFFQLVEQYEKNWLKENQQLPIEERNRCVQFWIKISEELVNPDYIEKLKSLYHKQQWDKVEIKWVEDRTKSLMVSLIKHT